MYGGEEKLTAAAPAPSSPVKKAHTMARQSTPRAPRAPRAPRCFSCSSSSSFQYTGEWVRQKGLEVMLRC